MTEETKDVSTSDDQKKKQYIGYRSYPHQDSQSMTSKLKLLIP